MSISKKKIIIAAILFFSLYLLLGLAAVKDYGVTADEPMQRMHSLVAYKHINKIVFNREVPELQNTVPSLEEYEHKYYGTAVQIPMVFVEDVFDFNLTSQNVFLMRHYCTFAIVYFGYVCLYIALRSIFDDFSFLPLLIVAMISLYPRFFANQFFDIKNMVFTGLGMITIWSMIRAVRKNSILSYGLFGVISAIATNCRIMGIIYPVIMVGYLLILIVLRIRPYAISSGFEDSSKNRKERMLGIYIIIIILSYFLTWIVISPFAWDSPIHAFIFTFHKFHKYDLWNGTMVFMGKLITCEERPWYYLFVWISISVPLIYIGCFIIENWVFLKKLIKKKNLVQSIVFYHKWESLFFCLFWAAVLAVVLLKSRIYVGWHHMYFIFVPFCIMAGYGIESLSKSRKKNILLSAMLLTLTLNAMWIVFKHPHEVSWFNAIGKTVADQFDREEWSESSYQALLWILDQEAGEVSIGGSIVSIASLSDENKERIIVGDTVPKYYIEGYRNVIGNTVNRDGYEEVYTISVDGYSVCTVFKLAE